MGASFLVAMIFGGEVVGWKMASVEGWIENVVVIVDCSFGGQKAHLWEVSFFDKFLHFRNAKFIVDE